MTNTKIIGNKIAEARKEKKMTQAQLAQYLFISHQAVGKWERGESMPDITTFNRLADILGVELNYFSENIQVITDKTLVDDQPKPISGINSKVRQVPINLTAINLEGSDFAGVTLNNGKFKVSSLHRANFNSARLSESSFEVLDASEASFDDSYLTDCKFLTTDLTGASFRNSTLVKTLLNMSGQGAAFVDSSFLDATFSKSDLRTTTFENCNFEGVDFNYCDLRAVRFDHQTFIGVKFEKSALEHVSFRGATLKNVSFTVPFSLTNKSYQSIKTVCFDEARMDKLTYAALKGLWILDLSKVIII
jgi:uncharacterized protein YjbI with pentapeptide repeats/DNA-binding XRE family transcriptional regulator